MTDEQIDPLELDRETLAEVKRAVRGFPLAEPDRSPTELGPYPVGKHDAYASVIWMLTSWIEKLDEHTENGRNDEHRSE